MNVVEKKVGVSNRVSSFTLPMGATVNMDGTALYQGVAVVFIVLGAVPLRETVEPAFGIFGVVGPNLMIEIQWVVHACRNKGKLGSTIAYYRC